MLLSLLLLLLLLLLLKDLGNFGSEGAKEPLNCPWYSGGNITDFFPGNFEVKFTEYAIVEGIPVSHLTSHTVSRLEIMNLHELGEVVLHDLRNTAAIAEVAGNVTLWAGDGDAVDPEV